MHYKEQDVGLKVSNYWRVFYKLSGKPFWARVFIVLGRFWKSPTWLFWLARESILCDLSLSLRIVYLCGHWGHPGRWFAQGDSSGCWNFSVSRTDYYIFITIRQLDRESSQSSLRGRLRCVYHSVMQIRCTLNAANSLLKFIEEPFKYQILYFSLTADDSRGCYWRLKSRAQLFIFPRIGFICGRNWRRRKVCFRAYHSQSVMILLKMMSAFLDLAYDNVRIFDLINT